MECREQFPLELLWACGKFLEAIKDQCEDIRDKLSSQYLIKPWHCGNWYLFYNCVLYKIYPCMVNGHWDDRLLLLQDSDVITEAFNFYRNILSMQKRSPLSSTSVTVALKNCQHTLARLHKRSNSALDKTTMGQQHCHVYRVPGAAITIQESASHTDYFQRHPCN